MTDAAAQRFEQTHALLSDTVKSCERLYNALQDERVALAGDDAGALDSAVGRKKVHLAALEKLEQRRRALLAACRYKEDLQSMQRFVLDNDRNRELQALWSRTLELLAACRKANQTNGAVINSQRRNTGEALSVLRNEPQEPETYGATGKTETTGQYRALAEV